MTTKVYYAIGDVQVKAQKLTRLHSRMLRKLEINFPEDDSILVHLDD